MRKLGKPLAVASLTALMVACGGTGGGGTTEAPDSGIYTLVRMARMADLYGGVVRDNFYAVIDPKGNVVNLSQDEASVKNRNLTRQGACSDGKALLEDSGEVFLFDPQNLALKSIADLGGTPAQTTITNTANQAVGYYLNGPNADLIFFCDGGYYVTNENLSWVGRYGNTVIMRDNLQKKLLVFTIPSSLQAQAITYENKLTPQKVEVADKSTNNFSFVAMAVSDKYAFIPEQDQNNDLVGIAVVDFASGTATKITQFGNTNLTQNPINVNILFGGDAVDLSGKTVFVFSDGSNIIYGSYDGSKLTPIGSNPITITGGVAGAALDGNGNLYWIENGSLNMIKSRDTGGTDKSASTGGSNFNNVFGSNYILPASNGVALKDMGGTYYTYDAGSGNLNTVNTSGDLKKALDVCSSGSITNQGTDRLTCFDPGAGQNEIAFIKDLANVKLANPDGLDTNNNLSSWGTTPTGGVWVRDNFAWYHCPYNDTNCTALQNVTPTELSNFSSVPRSFQGWGAYGGMFLVDLINDDIKTYNYTPAGAIISPADLSAIVSPVAHTDSLCGAVNTFSGIVVAKLSTLDSPADPIEFRIDNTSYSDAGNTRVFDCISAVVHAWPAPSGQ